MSHHTHTHTHTPPPPHRTSETLYTYIVYKYIKLYSLYINFWTLYTYIVYFISEWYLSEAKKHIFAYTQLY